MKKLPICLLCLVFSLSIFATEDTDLFEPTNRAIFTFNQGLDEAVFEPVAKSWQENVSKLVQNGVSNFSSNIEDVSTLVNEIAQFELINGVNTLGRVLLNSTLGLFGLFDVASDRGLEKTQEDFGQTMQVWGSPKGSYVVLPVFGSSTLSDTIGKVVDSVQKVKHTKHVNSTQKIGTTVLQAVDTRVKLLPAIDLVNSSDDPYITARSAYLQKLEYDVHNGNPPTDEEF